MSKQVLDVEQMKHLQELGLDTSNASAKVYKVSETENYCGYSRDIVVFDGYVDNYIDKYDTFTLQDILDLLPNILKVEEGIFWLELGPHSIKLANAYAQYRSLDGYTYKTTNGDTLIDAAYEMLLFFIEKGGQG